MKHIGVAWGKYRGYSGLYVGDDFWPHSIHKEVISSDDLSTTKTGWDVDIRTL